MIRVKPGPHQQQCRSNWQQNWQLCCLLLRYCCWCGPGFRFMVWVRENFREGKCPTLLEVDEWCTTVCTMTRKHPVKVKVTSPSKLEIRPFSKAMSSAIYNGSWQLTTNSLTRAQYLHFIGPDFWYLSSFFCHVTLNLAETSVVTSRPSVQRGANFLLSLHLLRLVLVSFGKLILNWITWQQISILIYNRRSWYYWNIRGRVRQ